MLILSRIIGKKIVIGDNIFISVIGVRGNQVRLGIDAPRNIGVHREEIKKRIDEEKQFKEMLGGV